MTNNDIKLICNYEERESISPNSKLTYIDFNIINDDEYLLELKNKNRQLALGAVLDNKVDEYNNRTIHSSETTYPQETTGPRLHTIGLTSPIKFKSYDDIWILLMNHFEKNTKNPHHYVVKNGADKLVYQSTNGTKKDDNDAFIRKIIVRITSMSGMIASGLSRIGPATFAVVGSDIVPYFDSFSGFTEYPNKNENPFILGSFGGIVVIHSDLIKSNKVIVGRSENKLDHGGISIINDLTNFYMVETPHTFYKKFAWFEVI